MQDRKNYMSENDIWTKMFFGQKNRKYMNDAQLMPDN